MAAILASRAIKLLVERQPAIIRSRATESVSRASDSTSGLDLKESGDIENHANVFWSIHRKNLQDQDRVPVEFMLPKRRDGRWNIFHDYWFFPNHQRFDARCTSPGGMEAGGK